MNANLHRDGKTVFGVEKGVSRDFGGYIFKTFKYNFSYCITYRMTSGILEVFWTLFDALTVL